MKRWIWWGIGGAVALSLLAFVIIQQKNKRCQGIVIQLDEQAEYPFFTEDDIKNLVNRNGSDQIEDLLFEKINLRTIESRVLKNRLIKKCQAYRDLSGHLVVAIEQQKPIGRLVGHSSGNQLLTASQGGYLTETGELMPLSSRFAARVVLVSGNFFKNPKKNLRSENGQKLVELLKTIQKDPLWKAQLTELIVLDDGEITMLPLVGKYQIEFGLPDDFDKKLKKLSIFYNTILPLKNWERYKRVSVKFKNQIVCELKSQPVLAKSLDI